jgi:hypothetical protein
VIDITQNLDELQKFRNNYPDCEILKTYENLEIVNDFNPDVFDVYLKFKNN